MIMIEQPNPFLKACKVGFTLAELLISLALMALISLAFVDFVVKGNAIAASLNMRISEASEIQMLFKDIQQDLRQGASISDNSHNNRLEYTTYSSTGVSSKKIYRITTISGTKYLQLSTDGGTTWISPYRISAYTKYVLQGTPKFLYSWAINNCTDFVDSSPATPDGIWVSGSDTAGAYLACLNGTSSPALTLPSQATKLSFHGFQFSTGMGSPEATRVLPTDIFIKITTPYVRDTTAMTSPAVKDPVLLHAFTTNTANSLFGTAFDVKSATWDAARDRLIVVGNHSSGSNTIYQCDRKGVLIGAGLTTSTTTIQADSVAVKTTVDSILVLDAAAKYVYQFSVSGSGPLATAASLNLASPSNLVNTPTAIAYDPSTPNDFYIVGTDPADSGIKISERNFSTGALVGTAWTLPAAFDSTHPPGGLAIEPVNGDFIVVRNYINGSAPNQTIDIYIITRATGSSTSFSVNINDLGSSATGILGNWGLGYDPLTNRLFLSDTVTDKVYEVIPSQLISPQS